MTAPRGDAFSRQLLKVFAAVVLLLVVFKVTGPLDRRLSTLPPLIELIILLAAGAAGLAVRMAARRRNPEPARAGSVPPAVEPLAAPQLPPTRPAARAVDPTESSRASEIPAVDPYADLESSLAHAARVLEAAAGALATVTRTCASVLDRIDHNRRDAYVATEAVAMLSARSAAPAQPVAVRPHATAMEPVTGASR